jgi:membrane protease YdiL (CAAX protease family)
MAALSEKHISYTAGFFMLIAFAIGGMFIGGFISLIVVMLMNGNYSINFLTEITTQPKYFREMQVMEIFSTVFGFFLSTVFAASRMTNRPMTLTGFKGKISNRQFLFTVLIIFCGLALSSSLGYLSYQIPFPAELKNYFLKLEKGYAETAEMIIKLDSPFELIISLIVMAVFPAVCEETFFRGGLQNYLYRSTRRFWFSVIVVSFIFSIVHPSFFGFLSRFMLGILLGLLYQYSGKLWLPILAHFINNAAVVVMMYFETSKGKSLSEIANDKDGTYWGFLAIPVIVFLFMKFRNESLIKKSENAV